MKFACTGCGELLDPKDVIVASGNILAACGITIRFYCNECYQKNKEKTIAKLTRLDK
ncbi:MAG: hypothetical protein OEX01_01190 [Candidatus Bathyarchaeota archaeon]|nr:hypothetical protein [Candidatus Bathyarchaeota archaeon]